MWRLTFIISVILLLPLVTPAQVDEVKQVKELQTSVVVLADKRIAIGGEAIFRPVVTNQLKLGFGMMVLADFNSLGIERVVRPYEVLFVDALRLIGRREKLAVGSQIGYGFYRYENTVGGIVFEVSGSYRASLNNRKAFTFGPFLIVRNLRLKNVSQSSSGTPGLGLKLGVVF